MTKIEELRAAAQTMYYRPDLFGNQRGELSVSFDAASRIVTEQEQRIEELELKLSVLEPDNKQLFSDNNAQAIRLSEQEHRIVRLDENLTAARAQITQAKQQIIELQEQQREAVRFAHNAQDERDAALRKVAEVELKLLGEQGILEIIRPALEASKPAEGTWQPIATVPSDGTLVLVGFADGHIQVWRSKPNDGTWLWYEATPVYWATIAPLPAPPATEPKKE